MSEKSQALRLINNLLADIREPEFIWQVVTLIVCIGSALLFARWWRSRHTEGSGRLNDASARLAFPLTGMVLTGLAITVLDNFQHTHLLKLAMPLLGSMALVRGVIFVLRQAFPKATWLTAWERIIATLVWSWLALYITDLAPYVIDAMEQVQFHIGKQHIDLWTVLRGIVTVFLTVVFALWIAGVVEARLMRIQTLDANLRIVGVRVAKAVLTVVAILATVGIAQAGLVVGLVDRLFKAEIRVLTAVIEGLKKELEKREAMDSDRDDQVADLERRVQRIEDRLEDCLQGGSPRCAK